MNSRSHLVEVSHPGAVTRRNMQTAEKSISGIASRHYVVSVYVVCHARTLCDANGGDINQQIIFQRLTIIVVICLHAYGFVVASLLSIAIIIIIDI